MQDALKVYHYSLKKPSDFQQFHQATSYDASILPMHLIMHSIKVEEHLSEVSVMRCWTMKLLEV